MKMKITQKLIITLFAAVLVFIFACNNEGTNEKVITEKNSEEKHNEEETAETIITAEQVKLMGIESEKSQLQNI